MKIDKTFDGIEVLVGTNKKENDILITTSSPNAMWFHLANGLPSPHVVVDVVDVTDDKKMIIHCARLCKENSKYRNFRRISVIYTKIGNLKRIGEGKVIIKGKYEQIII